MKTKATKSQGSETCVVRDREHYKNYRTCLQTQEEIQFNSLIKTKRSLQSHYFPIAFISNNILS